MYLKHYSIKAFFFFVILENFCHFLILMRFVSFGVVRLVLEG
ncbi:putative membrane protein [Helicobacter pylori CPY1313]|nr:putative membrane protein [Helicobacter pylori CPY1313]